MTTRLPAWNLWYKWTWRPLTGGIKLSRCGRHSLLTNLRRWWWHTLSKTGYVIIGKIHRLERTNTGRSYNSHYKILRFYTNTQHILLNTQPTSEHTPTLTWINNKQKKPQTHRWNQWVNEWINSRRENDINWGRVESSHCNDMIR